MMGVFSLFDWQVMSMLSIIHGDKHSWVLFASPKQVFALSMWAINCLAVRRQMLSSKFDEIRWNQVFFLKAAFCFVSKTYQILSKL